MPTLKAKDWKAQEQEQPDSRSHPSHKTRDTTLASWQQLDKLGEKQRKVYNCIRYYSGQGVFLTDREIALKLGFTDPNRVRPRRYELMKAELITEAGKRPCTVSNRLALTWRSASIR